MILDFVNNLWFYILPTLLMYAEKYYIGLGFRVGKEYNCMLLKFLVYVFKLRYWVAHGIYDPAMEWTHQAKSVQGDYAFDHLGI